MRAVLAKSLGSEAGEGEARAVAEGSYRVQLGICLLDTALDVRMGSRFHTTSERTGAIASWLRSTVYALGASGLPLGLVLLQNVYAQDSRTALCNLLAGELGFRHVVTQVGRTSLIARDSGLLVASRHKVLQQHFVPFPWHREWLHPACPCARGVHPAPR